MLKVVLARIKNMYRRPHISTGHYGSVEIEYEDLYICSSPCHAKRTIYRVGQKPAEDAYTYGKRMFPDFLSSVVLIFPCSRSLAWIILAK